MLTTPRLSLRQYTRDDVPLLHRITSDPVTMSFYPAPFSLEQTAKWIDRSIASYEANGYGRYAVHDLLSGDLIGCAGFFQTEVNGKPEIDLGYIIAREHWGKGYATEAARACLNLAGEKKLGRIVIQMADDHERSWRVAERLGAKLETTFYNTRNRGYLTRLYVIDARG